MKLRIIVTGGTFDKEYNELNGELFFRDTHVGEMLRLGRSRLVVEVDRVLMIDSLHMTAAHRRKILAACRAAKERHIVVTHGTDTMPETARLLAKELKCDKTVVLTGAMVPYKFGSSDGLFNLGSALSFAQVLPPGVYVAMNGRWFAAHNVRKNKLRGEFEEIN
jgi:L-asparaginase